MAIAHLLTYDDLRATPEDGRRYELLGGEILVTASPTTKHQRAVKRLEDRLFDAEEAGQGTMWAAPIDVYLDEHNVVVPDLIFVRADRQQIVSDEKIEGAPDLVVEVLSPSTARTDIGRGTKGKLRLYERFGVPYYWLVDPTRETIAVYTLHEGSYPEPPVVYASGALVCPLFPDFPIDINRLFA